MTRDLTKKQYRSALSRFGFKELPFMGYVKLPPPCDDTHICSLNAGDNLRDRLAYLMQEWRVRSKL